MKNKKILLALTLSTLMLAGCKNGVDGNMLASSGMSAYKAATLSDADAKSIANQGCKEMDSENKLAGSSSKYSKRLAKIAKALGNNINGTPVNYKVYMTSDVNAWAMANGCVRVYSGLMDMMTDNEVEAVLGHELGHVALGHSLQEMKAAYAVVAARDAISATSGVAAQLSKSQLGDIAEGAINAKFSREKESEADDFSYDLLKKRGIKTQGLVGSFDKLASLDAGHTKSLFDSHPPSAERAQHIRDRIAQDKK
ncbi:M48 family metallopeptidase [Superficieibacter sp. HKU1]|uniref:metalloprotease LoiP n=1 Tax=Superficieibacter sp. HKU1 TaxID=3031919 RepID=UPI0023E217DC|nr:M48 family metallopeptidase [Superficieibacter sp. HKU1]WES70028.1 M48 family metallopeptidase [Superficieibacter sp. HKU1]